MFKNMSNFREQTVYPEAGGWEEKEWRKVNYMTVSSSAGFRKYMLKWQ